MKIAVTGATGTLGKAIMLRLSEAGHSVIGIGRNQAKITAMQNQNHVMKRCDIGNLAVYDCIIELKVRGSPLEIL